MIAQANKLQLNDGQKRVFKFVILACEFAVALPLLKAFHSYYFAVNTHARLNRAEIVSRN